MIGTGVTVPASASGSKPILEPAVFIAVLSPGIHGRGYAPSRGRRNPAVHMQFLCSAESCRVTSLSCGLL